MDVNMDINTNTNSIEVIDADDTKDYKIKELIDNLSKKYTKDSFTRLIRGKRVIIVGPSTKLKGKGLGKWIDSFDLVVRHNTVFDYLPFNSKYRKDYGSRTDIIYFSPTCMNLYTRKIMTLRKLRLNKIKYIVYQNGNKNRKYMTGKYCFPLALSWFKYVVPRRTSTKLHYSDKCTRMIIKLMNRKEYSKKSVIPRTGFISIFDMLVHGAKKVETIGMSFEEGGGHAFRPDAVKNMDPLKTHRGLDSPHDSTVEFKLVQEYIKINPDRLRFR